MKLAYKLYPADSDPGYGGAASTWMPILPVSLVIRHAKSPRIDTLVDSGAYTTYFRSDIGRAFGRRVEEGEPGQLRGVVDAPPAKVYYHRIKLCIAEYIIASEHIIPIKAGFYDKLGWAGILGRHGFFEHFVVAFDPCNNPPGLEITRIHRAKARRFVASLMLSARRTADSTARSMIWANTSDRSHDVSRARFTGAG